MPCNLEAHLDGGFQAVRDALRRRMSEGVGSEEPRSPAT